MAFLTVTFNGNRHIEGLLDTILTEVLPQVGIQVVDNLTVNGDYDRAPEDPANEELGITTVSIGNIPDGHISPATLATFLKAISVTEPATLLYVGPRIKVTYCF